MWEVCKIAWGDLFPFAQSKEISVKLLKIGNRVVLCETATGIKFGETQIAIYWNWYFDKLKGAIGKLKYFY